jgi:predicted GNAT family acetyltransferase
MLKIQRAGYKMIRYKKIDLEDKSKIVEYLLKNKSENALLLYDLENLYPKEVDFLLALNEEQHLVGLNLIWFGAPPAPSIHLRANDSNIADGLIDTISYNKNLRVVLPRIFSTNIEDRFRDYTHKDNLYFMTLDLKSIKSSPYENYDPHLKTRRLSNNDKLKVERLFLGSTDTDKGLEKWVMSSLDKEIIFGCFDDAELCSIAGTLFKYEDIAMIGNVFTKKERRGEGLATKVLVSLIQYLSEYKFKELQLYAVENGPAHSLYQKLGFKEKEKYVRFII